MTRRHELKLGWACALALLLHVVVLTAAARLPVAARGGELGQLQVFDAAAPVVVSSVSLVQFAAPKPRAAAHQVIAPAVPEPTAEELAPAAPIVDETEPQPVPPHRAAPGSSAPRTSEARPGGSPAPPAVTPTPPAPGGGGGAPVDVGPGAGSGTASATPGEGTGTPPGEVPGEGTGRGAGTGRGTGSGAGAGQGGGEGDHPASGDGSGEGTGTAAPEAPKHRPTPPDRAEPKLVHKEAPVYPDAAAEQGVEGTCTLKVLVGEKGEVQSVEVTRSSGDARLDKAAVACVRRWRYRPAVQGGKPHAVATWATVEFALK